jgi:hypothetical protein
MGLGKTASLLPPEAKPPSLKVKKIAGNWEAEEV